MTDDAGQTTRQSWNMVKRIISKGLGLGGARIFTVGLGVMLAVILALAAATASPTPAVAQGGPVVRGGAVMHRVEGQGKVHDPSPVGPAGQPYSVPVVTFWHLDNWEDCISPLQQRLERRDGNGPWQLVWTGTDPDPNIREYLDTDKVYQYRQNFICRTANGAASGITDGVPFSIHVVEDDFLPIFYNGQWVVSTRGGYSGNSTHVARQVEANATLTYRGIAVAWVTTLDSEDEAPARVACDRVLCASVDTSNPTRKYRYRRVAWSDTWHTGSTGQIHRVQVIADDRHFHVDVDAFIIIREE